MCECQALHPDPEDDDSDNDFEGEEYDVEEAGEAKLKRIDAECTWLNVTMKWPVKMGLISVWMIQDPLFMHFFVSLADTKKTTAPCIPTNSDINPQINSETQNKQKIFPEKKVFFLSILLYL